MSLCLFLGPTLPRSEAAALIGATILPPAAQGDVWRAAQARPTAIGIVDGYFSGAPSVWHKEILWALSQGIQVFGSASMGALRAAELHAFGMRGVGRIFEDFRDGRLEDDDEVAVTHGPAELGYPALSEAMVNIRATLTRAETQGVLKRHTRRKLEAHAKALHFPERSWPALLESGAHGAGRKALAALRGWLPEGRVDLKREDALEMIRAMREALGPAEPPAAPFRFERTHFWDEMVARCGAAAGPDQSSAGVLDELRLAGPEAYALVRTRALARLLAGHAAVPLGVELTRESMSATLARLRAERGLYTRAALDAWLAENGLDTRQMERLVEDEARLEAVTARAGAALDSAIIDELRLSGDWPRLARRALEKAALPSAPAPAPEPMALREWYFRHRLGRPVPEDLVGFVRDLGFATLADFDNALRREILCVEFAKDLRNDPDG